MAYQISRRTVVAAKIESSEGTDSVPTTSADTQLVFGNPNPWKPDTRIVTKDTIRDSLTPQKDLVGRQLSNIEIMTVLMTKNSAGVAGLPYFDPLLKSCGWSVAAGGAGSSSSWNYTPVSTSFPSSSIYVWLDGLLAKSLGCKGSFVLNMVAGECPDLTFRMQGTYADPTNTTFPTATYPTDTKTMVQSENLIIGPGYGAAAGLICRSINLDWGAVLAERGSVNNAFGYKGNVLTRREPRLTLVVECEDSITNKNFFAYLNSAQDVADASMDTISWTHLGPSSGAQSKINFQIKSPQLQTMDIGDDNGIRTYTLGYKLRHGTSNSEAMISFMEAV